MPVRRPCTRAPKTARQYHVWRGLVRVSWWWRGRFRGLGLPTWGFYVLQFGVPVLQRLSKERPMPVIRPRASSPSEARGALHGSWSASLPSVSSWLCDPAYPDGAPIGPVQLQLRREGSVIRATLKISDQGGLKLSAVETSPLDALLALDLLLSSEDAPWEADAYPLGAKPAPRKK